MFRYDSSWPHWARAPRAAVPAHQASATGALTPPRPSPSSRLRDARSAQRLRCAPRLRPLALARCVRRERLAHLSHGAGGCVGLVRFPPGATQSRPLRDPAGQCRQTHLPHRGRDCHQSPHRFSRADVARVRDEGGVDVRSCSELVKGDSSSCPPLVAGLPLHSTARPGNNAPWDVRSSGSLAMHSGARKTRCVTGLKKFDATRALLSVPSGRGHLTRFRRCWRYGAALDVRTWLLNRRVTRLP